MLIIRRSELLYTASGIIKPIGVMIPDADNKLHYTASGIITPIGLMIDHTYRCDDRCDDTRGCVMQF